VKNRKSPGKGEKTPQNIVYVIAREGCTFLTILTINDTGKKLDQQH
jgi:hypothetical protein